MNESNSPDIMPEFLWVPDNVLATETNSPKMTGVYRQIESVSGTNATVLLTGETGTGKGIFARLIHRLSERRNKPFVSVHCSAIPDSLMESELFGHVKGAYTGAIRDKLGKFQVASGGTIFLDEIGTLPLITQIKLLQVLQDRVIQRVGEDQLIRTDVRIIAATNDDLPALCATKQFRTDLFYRLNVFPIEIPALRDRKEDIAMLIDSFLDRFDTVYNKKIPKINQDIYAAFKSHNWPGNVREMENIIERAYILGHSSTLGLTNIRFDLLPYLQQGEGDGFDSVNLSNMSLREVREHAIKRIEREYLSALLTMHHGVIKETAKSAGVSTRQINTLLTRHSIRKEDYKMADHTLS